MTGSNYHTFYDNWRGALLDRVSDSFFITVEFTLHTHERKMGVFTPLIFCEKPNKAGGCWHRNSPTLPFTLSGYGVCRNAVLKVYF